MKKRLSDTVALAAATKPTASDALCGRKTRTVEVRPISNGYIREIHEYSEGGGHTHTEEFHRQQPALEVRQARRSDDSGSLRGAVRLLKS